MTKATALNITSHKALTGDEVADHLNQEQCLRVLTECAATTFAGKPLRRYKFDPLRVLSRFTSDRTEDSEMSMAFGHSHVATRGEIASMIIARQAAMAAPKPDLGIDRDLADALAADDS